MTTSNTSASNALSDAERFERGCEWFLELREKAQSPEVVAEWLEWCRADPLNREAFERARSVWQATGDVRAEDLELPPLASPAVGTSEITRESPRHWSRFAIGGALAAGITAVALSLSSSIFLNVTTESLIEATFATKAGENRVMRLADGSTLVLGGDSHVLTSFDKDARRLTLERGEAYFRVKRDRLRPFIVTAGNFSVTAVGTAFNVRTSSDRVVVAVAEGIVSIEPPTLSPSSVGEPDQEHQLPSVLRDTLRASAGQEVVLDIADEQLQVVRVEPKAVASWQTGRLEFAREPLRAVLASVNRYSVRTVTLDDPALGNLRFTGTVFADRVDDWVRGLPAVFPVEVRDEGMSLVIESRVRDTNVRATVR